MFFFKTLTLLRVFKGLKKVLPMWMQISLFIIQNV